LLFFSTTTKETNIMPKKTDRRWLPWQRMKPEEKKRLGEAAVAAIAKLYAEIVPLWPGCRRGRCRRHHRCDGKVGTCLERAWPLLSPQAKEAALISLKQGGPRRLPAQSSIEREYRTYRPHFK
jgi:hypothetical protein